jgi:glycosyltransferase involved in cell wall biosynthesis
MATLGISAIIPTYNRAPLLARAINSALVSALADDEVIVADDASTDNTEAVLAHFGDRIRHVKFPHGGAGLTRNRAVQLATRPLIAFLDSDDEWLPDKLPLQRTLLEKHPDVLFCCSNFHSGLPSGETTPNQLANWHHDDRSWDDILAPGITYSSIVPLPAGRADFRVHIGSLYLAEMESDYIATSTVMVRREQAGPALRFAEDLNVYEDKECFASLARCGLVAYLDCETSIQWGHGGPRLTDVDAYEFASARLKVMDRIWGSDPGFVAQHGKRLQHARRKHLLRRARWLLVRGRTGEARADLREAAQCPLSYRLLAALPGPVASGVLNMRRLVRGSI